VPATTVDVLDPILAMSDFDIDAMEVSFEVSAMFILVVYINGCDEDVLRKIWFWRKRMGRALPYDCECG